MLRKIVALSISIVLILSTPVDAKTKNSGIKKNTNKVALHIGVWRNVPFIGPDAFTLNGERTLWFAQLHVKCSKAPRYIKLRLARHLPDGSLDTTGTTTWMLNGKMPKKAWQGTLVWETKSKYPMTVQYRISGGSGCTSDNRQFKWWQPGATPFLPPLKT